MSFLRRYYDLEPVITALTADEDQEHPELLVTYDESTGALHVGYRINPWDAWSVPLEPASTADDIGPAGRAYGADGRSYAPESGGNVTDEETAAGLVETVATLEAEYGLAGLYAYVARRAGAFAPVPTSGTLTGPSITGHGDVVADLQRAQDSSATAPAPD